MPSKNDLTGKTFKYLTVLQEEDDRHQGAGYTERHGE